MNIYAPRFNCSRWPRLVELPVSAKTLVTATILVMGIALIGALAQIVVHDIIPTFFTEKMLNKAAKVSVQKYGSDRKSDAKSLLTERGDLFADLPLENQKTQTQFFYKDKQFIWLLKWSHIHLFGMNMIFIFMGAIASLLDTDIRIRTWLVVLPFIGVLIDISAMWLRAYISPFYFWLHIPGGGLFVTIYMIVSIRAIREMWLQTSWGNNLER
ncbi:MAG: hypothetical protein JRH18_13720 [Deltaproteobacteria bacterium]|nr:hypothetical protein [Deltaproteobacteria bacterium]MBW1961286.1 hypothetical protein [Deltaproteobacteria bacterium]MBW2152714.1 hypothetical protein [Deltaproteobacteria bacterium]